MVHCIYMRYHIFNRILNPVTNRNQVASLTSTLETSLGNFDRAMDMQQQNINTTELRPIQFVPDADRLSDNVTEETSDHFDTSIDVRVRHRLCFRENHGCGICYEAVGPAEEATCMFCCHHLHIVHNRCLVRWCAQKHLENLPSSCPFCRKHLLMPAQFDELYTWKEDVFNDTPTTSIFSYFPC